MKLDILFVLLVILITYFIWKIYLNDESVHVHSTFDNNEYIIRGGKNKEQFELLESANTLAIINSKVLKLIEHLSTKYSNDSRRNYWIKFLKDKYRPSILSEAANDKRYTTFTIDKQDMHICLRTRDEQQNLYDINILMYVILHELAHVCNYTRNNVPIEGHGREFKDKFSLLVKEGMEIGIYKYENYHSSPREYCGMIINTQIINN